MRIGAFVLALVLMGALAPGDWLSPAAADDSPRESASLLRLVPDDVGLSIEIHRPLEAIDRLERSPLARRLRFLGPLNTWQSQYAPRLEAIGKFLGQRLSMDPRHLGNQLLGDHLVIAVWQDLREEEKSRERSAAPFGRGMILFQARDAELLEMAAAVLRGMGPSRPDGDGVQQRRHADVEYSVRTLRNGPHRAEICMATIGTIAIVTSDESLMRRSLDLHAGRPGAGSLADSDDYQNAARRWSPQTTVKVFLEPRHWDDEVLEEVTRTIDEATQLNDELAAEVTADLWGASRYWCFSAKLSEPFVVDAYLSIDRSKLSEAGAVVLQSMTGEAEFARRVPASAVLAFAGRIDIKQMASLLFSAGEEEDEPRIENLRTAAQADLLGLDLFDEVLTLMGPDTGSFLIPAKSGGPPNWAMGVRTRSRDADDPRPGVQEALDNGLRQAMTAAVAEAAKRGTQGRVEISEVGTTRFTELVGLDTSEWRLPEVYAFQDDYFYVGDAPETILQSIELSTEQSLAESAQVKRLLSPLVDAPSQLLYVDSAGLRRLLDGKPEALIRIFTTLQPVDPAALRSNLTALVPLIGLADRLVVAAQVDNEGVALSFGLEIVSAE